MVVAVTAGLQGEAAAWAADLYSDHAQELADVGLFLDALKTRFEDPSQVQRAEAELLGLRQRGRPVREYIREFQRVAGRLHSWPQRLLVHHFRAGLDSELCRACVVRGIPGCLPEWFKVVMELHAGLREFHQTPDEQPQPRQDVERLKEASRQTPMSSPRPRAVFRCFRCNRPGHRVAKCPVPAIPSIPTATRKPGATPRKTMERSRATRQAGGGPSQQSSGEQTPALEEYKDGDRAEDPMVSEPIAPFAIPITLTSPLMGRSSEYHALIDTGCTRCLISREVVQTVGIRVTRLASPIRFEQVDESLWGGGSCHVRHGTGEDGNGYALGNPPVYSGPIYD
ncbi:RTL1: Retrotransposon-like 1 [Crotalus adamanteus]|uniref:RTL1: Retrotransposon-like 1 n=1 Tax=Crotalus adamanteus TaxID=8729 RepID=A0AAW1B1M2_CROAD